MTIKNWVTYHYGLAVKYNKTTSGYQCVDLAKSFLAESDTVAKGGIYKKYPELAKSWAWGNAKDWYLKPNAYTKAIFDFLPPETEPKLGDLIVFKSGQYGHIAVALGFNDSGDVLTIDQNYSGKAAAAIYKHNRANITGILRAKR